MTTDQAVSAPHTAPTETPLTLRGAARFAYAAMFFILVAVWAIYLIGFRQAATIRADGVVCAMFTQPAELLSYRSTCTALGLGAEVVSQSIFLVSALILFLRKPNEVMTVLGASMLLLLSAGISTVTLGLSAIPVMQPITRLMLGAGLWSVTTFLLLFPDGRLRPRWTWLLSAAYAMWVLSWWFVPALDISRLLTVNFFPLLALSTVPSVLRLWLSYRRYFSAQQRQQTRWVVLGVIGTVTLYLVFVTIALTSLNNLRDTPLGLILFVISIMGRWVAVALIPLTILISVARYRLWDVDLVIGRAVAIGAVTLILSVVFVGALLLVQRIATSIVGGDQSGLALAVASLAVAVLFNPVRDRLRKAIDARFFPSHAVVNETLQRASALNSPAWAETDALTTALDQPTAAMHDTPAAHDRQSFRRDGLTGEQFAGFTLTGLIGRGGMAEVYRARQHGLNRDVAIKILASGLADDNVFRARFEREGHTLAQLNHPNIVKIFDAGAHNGIFYIAMEYIDGESLASALARDGIFTLERALPILRGVASALDHAHAHGVIHRDVKPHNIMLQHVDPTGNDTPDAQPLIQPIPILMDFGIARIEAAHTALTGGSGALGTLDYIAPEQIIETSQVDGRADIYALAVVAYQMLAGRLPFKEANAAAVIMSHLQKPAPDPRTFEPMIPMRTAMTILRAMAKDPDERPDTAGAFAEALG
ncbi:MAG: protein kinase [Chloroflexota bacterium]|nr:protein kinase [Chloroflexota bacterium]